MCVQSAKKMARAVIPGRYTKVTATFRRCRCKLWPWVRSMLIKYYSLYSWLFCVNIFLTLVSCRVCFSPDCRFVYIYILYLYICTHDSIWTDLYLNRTPRQCAYKYISVRMHCIYIYTFLCIDSILVSVSPDLTAYNYYYCCLVYYILCWKCFVCL